MFDCQQFVLDTSGHCWRVAALPDYGLADLGDTTLSRVDLS
jgi:hypothetical protein